MSLRGIAVLVALLVSLPVSLAHPFIGVLTWNWLAYMNPHQQTWGALSGYRFALVVGAVTLAGVFLSRHDRLRAHGGREVWLVVLFFVTLIISTVYAANPNWAYDKLVQYAKIFAMCYIMISVVNTERRFRILVWTTALFVCAIGMKGAPIAALNPAVRIYGPPGSFLEDNNDYALGMNMMLPFFWTLGVTESNRRLKTFWYVCLLLTIGGVLFCYSRGGFIGLGLTIALVAWKSRRKALAAAVLIVGLVVGTHLAPDRLREQVGVLEAPTQVGSAQDRLRAWAVAINMARAHPFTGVGLRNFRTQYPRYADDMSEDYPKVAHSAYFHILGEAGYLSLLVFILIVVAALLTLRRLGRELKALPADALRPPEPPDTHTREEPDAASSAGARAPAFEKPTKPPIDYLDRFQRYVSMCQISIISYAVTAAFLSRADFDLYFQLIAMTVMLREMIRSAAIRAEAGEPAEEEVPAAALAPAPSVQVGV